MDVSDITEFLKTTVLFSGLPDTVLKAIAARLEKTILAGDEILFNQGDEGDSLYIVRYGCLHAVKSEADGTQRLLGTIKTGHVLGEIACLIDEKRTATVYAVRDSVLLKLSREAFNALHQQYPEIIMGITRQSIQRLVSPKKHEKETTATCFTLLPAGDFLDIETTAQRMAQEFSRYGDTLLLTEQQFNAIHGENSAQTPLEEDKSLGLMSWIQEMEARYKFIIYVAKDITPWSLRCLRQADKIILAGDLRGSSRPNGLEKILFQKQQHVLSNVDLILLGHSSMRYATNTASWLTDRAINNNYRIRMDNTADIARIVRILTGNALGLVLAGGGANALGHLGVIRALEEQRIPVDYIAGTSMGAIIGGSLAMGMSYDQMVQELERLFKAFRASLDYTLPISALLKTQKLVPLMHEYFGTDTRIEELWTNFFCMSTDISTNKAYTHDQDILWKAVRCSFSLPGIMPAIQDEQLHLHMDGGLLNNMPVDLLKFKLPECKILASSLRIKDDIPTRTYEDHTTSGWHLFAKHILTPGIQRQKPPEKKPFLDIVSAIYAAMVVASNKHQKSMVELADFNIIMDIDRHGLIDFTHIRQIADEGYQAAQKILPHIDLKPR